MLLKNEGILDRIVRLFLGEVLLLLGIFWLGGLLKIIILIIGFISLVTAFTGFCLLYRLFGVSTISKVLPKKQSLLFLVVTIIFIIILTAGSYYSNFFTNKIYIEDFNKMNSYYKQVLFYTGQEKRDESIANYDKLVIEYSIFYSKYKSYQPYSLSFDKKFENDLTTVLSNISELDNKVRNGNLKEAHTDLEKIRPIFQDIFKRNGFSMLAITLVDFHDAMEKIIAAADAKDSQALLAVYPEVSDKLKAVENVVNDNEIQAIRLKLEEVKGLAEAGNVGDLSKKAQELKSAFVKVYLKRG